MRRSVLLIIALSAILLNESHGKPTKTVENTDALNPAASTANNPSEAIVGNKNFNLFLEQVSIQS
jgi:hypothetical protein